MLTLFLTGAAELPCNGRALRYTPDRAHDPYLDDGAAPKDVAQMYFDTLRDLEAAAGRLRGDAAEAMEVHRFAVAQPWSHPPPRWCTYLVAYEGPAVDEAAWLSNYLAHHPPLIAKLPGIRELEIYTPIEWHCPQHLRCVRHLQRNKVAFDSRRALEAALASPVRIEMRADFARFPAYSGRVTHYAMTTEPVRA
jgi:uncharacterized protein (TIGR02118 family)